jgi:tetratricopeptide (TPR) repeat protein
VFLNYILDCLPADVLRIRESDVKQLCLRTRVARGIDLRTYTELTAEELARRAGSSDRTDQHELMECFPVLASEYDYRPVAIDSLPYSGFVVQFGQSCAGDFVHNFGAMQCLERLLDQVDDAGFILLNDYGSSQPVHNEGFEHQRFSGSTSVSLNFALLKSYFGDSGKCQWLEPPEQNGHIYSHLLGHKIGAATVGRFRERFGKAAFDWAREPADAARACLKHGRYDEAATDYGEALAREPRNWALMGEVARFLTFTLRDPSAGCKMAKAALALNPTCSSDLWNTLGDSLFMLGRIEEAQSAFLRALRINPNDVRAHYNLSFVYTRENDLEAALKSIAQGLALDKAGEFREGLLQKQSEVLGVLAQRHQQECRALANRISRRYYQGKPRQDGADSPQAGGGDGKNVDVAGAGGLGSTSEPPPGLLKTPAWPPSP